MTEQVGFEAPETQVLEIARKMRESDTGSSAVENDRRTGTSTGRDVARRVVAAGPVPRGPRRVPERGRRSRSIAIDSTLTARVRRRAPASGGLRTSPTTSSCQGGTHEDMDRRRGRARGLVLLVARRCRLGAAATTPRDRAPITDSSWPSRSPTRRCSPLTGVRHARSDAAQRDGARPGGSAADVPGPGHREPFARRIAEEIERARHAGTLDRVVLAAEPQILGLIRAALPDASREAVAAEVAKDLVRTEGRALLEHVPFEALAKSVLRI